MNLLWYHFCLTFVLTICLFPSTTSHRWCIPHADYFIKCNRCWCVGEGMFICGHIQCDDAPRAFWRSMKPTETERGLRAVEDYALKFKNFFPEKVAVLPEITGIFKRMLNWSLDVIKMFWAWLKDRNNP
ncbi:hypothetical protein ILUMI_11569 [Ignelater luminosus]|uniref:Uncharacterized protein n=1 Tax=Ignelater luminosus TaxID=2038154 RepID=A0A8K0D166_IGNLU|nr:hypothetical protein ILUMI_11569 [Ignelater luminosus]